MQDSLGSLFPVSLQELLEITASLLFQYECLLKIIHFWVLIKAPFLALEELSPFLKYLNMRMIK